MNKRHIYCLMMLLMAACNSLQKKPAKASTATADSTTSDKGQAGEVGAVNGTSVVSEYSGPAIDNTPNTVPTSGDYYTINVVPIIAKKCGSCHGASNPDSGLNLTDKQVLKTNFPNVANVITYGLMPQPLPGQSSADTLTDAEIAILEKWYNVEEP